MMKPQKKKKKKQKKKKKKKKKKGLNLAKFQNYVMQWRCHYRAQSAFTCSKLTIETSVTPFSSFSIVNFEHVITSWNRATGLYLKRILKILVSKI